jgi:hypothetical protein
LKNTEGHGHMAVVEGGYDGTKSLKSVKIFQADYIYPKTFKNRFGEIVISEAFNREDRKVLQFYIWEKNNV